MTFSLPTSSPAQRVLLFGSQALTVKSKFLQEFSTRLRELNNGWALDAVSSLPEIWLDVVKNNPKLKNVEGEKLLKQLDTAMRTGSIPESLLPLPNVILTPLTVIIYLIQYSAHLKAWLRHLSDSEEILVSTTSSTETLELCTGILSAYAVGCASTVTELQQYGIVAVRLGMLIGALVDAEAASSLSDGPVASFSVSWTGTESSATVNAVLEQFPEVRRHSTCGLFGHGLIQ